MGAEAGRRFHLKERLGAGAFGAVYLAEQDSGAGFSRRVALKVLHSGSQHNPEAGRRMRDEARILGRLAHRNIVTVIDLVKLGDQWAVVMDYVPGADADRLIDAHQKVAEPLPVPAALEIGAAVCEALHFAYHADDGRGGALRVLHRDVKPSNVLVTADGDVKVLDFGVARVNLDTRESRTGLRVGTERYMSPQRLCGEEDDLAGDVYAIAATVAELILLAPIGRSPVADDRHAAFVAATGDRLREQLGTGEAVDALVNALQRGLACEPSERPNPRDLADTLLGLSRKLDGEALVPYARRFVPRVEGLLGSAREAVSGTLAESSPPTAGLADAGRTLDELTAPSTMREVAPPAPVRAPAARTYAIAGVIAGLLLLGVVGAALAAGGALTLGALSLTKASPPELPAAAVEPAVAPVEPAVAPVVAAVEPPAVTAVEPPAVSAVEPAVVTAVAAVEPPKPEPRPAPRTAPAPAPVADGPRIDRAMVVLKDASSLEVTCGDTTATGTASARITGFPSGDCRVRATYLGKALDAVVRIDRAAQVTCTVDGEKLACS